MCYTKYIYYGFQRRWDTGLDSEQEINSCHTVGKCPVLNSNSIFCVFNKRDKILEAVHWAPFFIFVLVCGLWRSTCKDMDFEEEGKEGGRTKGSHVLSSISKISSDSFVHLPHFIPILGRNFALICQVE